MAPQCSQKNLDSYSTKQCKWPRLLTTMFISTQLFASIMNKKNRQCGYYKYIVKEDKEKQFCYLLRSCAKRMIDNINCPLGQNNFLEVRFFVPNLESCAEYCRDTQGCRYYWWYPIENSASPLYCYLFQQCAASDKEPEAALVIGGRHPGHYFLTENEHNDLIMRYVYIFKVILLLKIHVNVSSINNRVKRMCLDL